MAQQSSAHGDKPFCRELIQLLVFVTARAHDHPIEARAFELCSNPRDAAEFGTSTIWFRVRPHGEQPAEPAEINRPA